MDSVQLAIDDLDKVVAEYCRNDEDCKLLMTIPGVGVITAITYKSGLDDPSRFTDSETVGAYTIFKIKMSKCDLSGEPPEPILRC